MASAATAARRELARRTKPILCYHLDGLPKKKGGEDLYRQLRTAVASGDASLRESLVIPPCDARSWRVPAGWMWRIVCTEGPQVADMNAWNLNHPDERFYSSKTRQMHSTHLTVGDRLWSNMPYMRPLATITEDTIAYGFDEDGAGVHDVIGSRCDPYTNFMLNGQTKNTCCHSNLTRQALRDGLTEDDVHDVLNVFMCTGFTKDTHQYFTKPSPVVPGDYLEFLAETDLLVSASTCPQGDVSMACGAGGEPKTYPLAVEVYQPRMGWLESCGWSPSEPSMYPGKHGLSDAADVASGGSVDARRLSRRGSPVADLPLLDFEEGGCSRRGDGQAKGGRPVFESEASAPSPGCVAHARGDREAR